MDEKMKKLKAMVEEMRAILEGNEEPEEMEEEETNDPEDMGDEKELKKSMLAAKLKKSFPGLE